MKRIHGDICCYNISNECLWYLEARMLFLFLPRRPPSRNAQTDSLDQLDQISHTKHFEKGLFRNLLKKTQSELYRRSLHMACHKATLNGCSTHPDFFVLEDSFVKEVQATKVPILVSKHTGVKSQNPHIHPSISYLDHKLCTGFSSGPTKSSFKRWQISRMISRIWRNRSKDFFESAKKPHTMNPGDLRALKHKTQIAIVP